LLLAKPEHDSSAESEIVLAVIQPIWRLLQLAFRQQLHMDDDGPKKTSRRCRMANFGYINSKLETGIRSPLDAAILKLERAYSDGYLKRDEIPFDFERRRLSIVVEKKGATGCLLITKGAPEGILEVSDSYETDGRVVPLDAAAKGRCRQTFDELSAQGFRVLAVAYRMLDSHSVFSVADEHSLILAGYLAFADPPNPDAAESLAAMNRDGVEIKILTGDNELVARHICE
jgi:Mg2+-importing ATPase